MADSCNAGGSGRLFSKWSFICSINICSPRTIRNSSISMGYKVFISTLPTGKEKEERFTAIPNRLPAAMIWYSGAFSQKYFKEVNARSQSWISSKMISVFSRIMVVPAIWERIGSKWAGEILPAKVSDNAGLVSKLK